MKFDAEAHLKKHGDDPVKALLALHTDVEERERENFEARREIRELKKTVQDNVSEDGQPRLPKGKVIVDATDADLLKEYQALGKVSDLVDLQTKLETAQSALFSTAIKSQLTEAGVPAKYLDKAVKLIESDPDEFLTEKGDVVEFDAKKFAKEYPMFVAKADAAEDDEEDSQDSEDSESNDDESDDTENDKADNSKNDQKTKDTTIRVVGGKRNKEKVTKTNLGDVSKAMVQQTSYVPNILRGQEG